MKIRKKKGKKKRNKSKNISPSRDCGSFFLGPLILESPRCGLGSELQMSLLFLSAPTREVGAMWAEPYLEFYAGLAG